METEPRRWVVGHDRDGVTPDTAVVALTAADLPTAPAVGIGLHEAMTGDVAPARERVDIYLPAYRGKGLVSALSWLAARLAGPAAQVAWHLDKQQGPESIRKLLTAAGWELRSSRRGRLAVLEGCPPAGVAPPEPREFTAAIGSERLTFKADYGVFSPGEIDAGTRLLLEVALRCPPGALVADIGTGYGPLAIGLVRNGVASRAVATDIDCIALWLALCNAAAAGVGLDVRCSPDPSAVEASALTVCNIPTHINAAQTAAFMSGVLDRARHGRLLVVVHASLESRYTRYFTAAGLRPIAHHGAAHTVLGISDRIDWRQQPERPRST
jgi:16S rRNA G1207 methylase RsmC